MSTNGKFINSIYKKRKVNIGKTELEIGKTVKSLPLSSISINENGLTAKGGMHNKTIYSGEIKRGNIGAKSSGTKDHKLRGRVSMNKNGLLFTGKLLDDYKGKVNGYFGEKSFSGKGNLKDLTEGAAIGYYKDGELNIGAGISKSYSANGPLQFGQNNLNAQGTITGTTSALLNVAEDSINLNFKANINGQTTYQVGDKNVTHQGNLGMKTQIQFKKGQFPSIKFEPEYNLQ